MVFRLMNPKSIADAKSIGFKKQFASCMYSRRLAVSCNFFVCRERFHVWSLEGTSGYPYPSVTTKMNTFVEMMLCHVEGCSRFRYDYLL